MNGKEEFKKRMKEEGFTRQTVAAYVGDKSYQNLAQQLGSNVADLKSERLNELMNAIGWEIEFKRVPYRKVSRKYIKALAFGCCDMLYGENESRHREGIFYTTEEGYAILDNRNNADMSKGLIELRTEEELRKTLAVLAGNE